MEKPREIYLDACAQIGKHLEKYDFTYSKSAQRAGRSSGAFTFQIWFKSSMRNIAGQSVALWIYANVRSKRLAEWRASQSHPLRSDDWVAGAQIGNLRTPPHWLDLNLANTQSRSGAIADALATIERLAIPYFERFDGLQTLFEYLMVHDLPGMEAPLPIEFLLCFGGRELAERYFHRFLRERPDISSQYRSCLEELRSNGLPKIFRSGYAIGLAYATVGYQLKSPDAT